MLTLLPTIILRHRRENLKKCSLRGLETRKDMRFLTYPRDALPDLGGYVMLSMEGPELSMADADSGIFLLDSTWRYAEVMAKTVPEDIPKRSLPKHFKTAYPRRQDDCSDPDRGLASIEALFIAYYLTGRDTTGLLDHYYWSKKFIDELNPDLKHHKSHQYEQ